jgi:predicted DNA-binding transcriptional regulator AlpA
LPQLLGNNMSENNSEILSIHEVAANLRCSKAHVYNAINGKVSGVSQLPAIPMGRRKLVRRSSLESWKAANESASENTAVRSIRE